MHGSRPRKAKTVKLKESTIQRQVMIWLKQSNIFAWYVKSMGTFDARRKVYRKPPWYFTAGVPDLHILHNGVYLAIELKSETGKLSTEQMFFQQDFDFERGDNMHWAVARSLEEVQDLCRKHGVIK